MRNKHLSTEEQQVEAVECAIDHLIDLEGFVYPHGLPPELSTALRILRSKRTDVAAAAFQAIAAQAQR